MTTFRAMCAGWKTESIEAASNEIQSFRARIYTFFGAICTLVISFLPVDWKKNHIEREKKFAALILAATDQIVVELVEYQRCFYQWESENWGGGCGRSETISDEEDAYRRAVDLTTQLQEQLLKAGNWSFWYRPLMTPKQLVIHPWEGHVTIEKGISYWGSIKTHAEAHNK